jgi:hypothetical protein
MTKITLIHAVQVNRDTPSEWDAWDVNGRYWHLRYIHGRGTISLTYDTTHAASSFADSGVPDITLEDMLAYLGVGWAPLIYDGRLKLEKPPRRPE